MLESFYPPLPWDTLKAQWPYAQHSQFIHTTDVRWHVQMFQRRTVQLFCCTVSVLHPYMAGNGAFLSKHFQVIAVDTPGHAFQAFQVRQTPPSGIARSLRELLDSTAYSA
jgi:hypothetical protein